jgi:hypothetical protein
MSEPPGNYRVHVATWNVGSVAPNDTFDLRRLVHANFEDTSLPDIVIVGLQEVVELSDMSAYVNQDEACVKKWCDELDKAFALLSGTQESFKRVTAQQLVGVALFVYIRESRLSEVTNVQVTTVGVGMLGLGNKGAVVASLQLCKTTECAIVCAHLAAHVEQLDARNKNFHDIVAQAQFEASESDDEEDCKVYVSKRELKPKVVEYSVWSSAAGLFETAAEQLEAATGSMLSTAKTKKILDHHCTIWLGDLNYRLSEHTLKKEECLELLQQWEESPRESIEKLFFFDQLERIRQRRKAFQEFDEPPVRFMPTYKYKPGTSEFDTSKRMPAWCDRVLWRDSVTIQNTMKRVVEDIEARKLIGASPPDDSSRKGSIKLKVEMMNKMKIDTAEANAQAAAGSGGAQSLEALQRQVRKHSPRRAGRILSGSGNDVSPLSRQRSTSETATGSGSESNGRRNGGMPSPTSALDAAQAATLISSSPGSPLLGSGYEHAAEGGVVVCPFLYGSLPADVHDLQAGAPLGYEATEEQKQREIKTFQVSDHRPVFCALTLIIRPSKGKKRTGVSLKQGTSPPAPPAQLRDERLPTPAMKEKRAAVYRFATDAAGSPRPFVEN